MSGRDEEATSPTTTPRPGGRRHARPPGQFARAEQADRLARAGRRPRRRARPAALGVVTAVIFAVVGVYLGAHYAANGSAGHNTTRRPPDVRGHATASPKPSSSPHPTGQAGDYKIAQARYTFAEHHTVTGNRTLQVTVRFPSVAAGNGGAAGKYPLIVFAPGFRQCVRSYSDLLHQWASAGFVVAAVNFPMTNCNVAAPDESDLSNQPADMRFVIQRLLSLSKHSGDRLTGLIAADRVAVAGHSDGGDTVAAMAAASCCRDPSLRAVIVLAGAEWPPLRGRWFSAPTPPMIFVQGTGDICNPPTASINLYRADTTGIHYYLQLFGANHLAPYEGQSQPEPVVEQVTLDFLDRYLSGELGAAGAMRQAARNPGVSELVGGGRMPSGDQGQSSATGGC